MRDAKTVQADFDGELLGVMDGAYVAVRKVAMVRDLMMLVAEGDATDHLSTEAVGGIVDTLEEAQERISALLRVLDAGSVAD